MDPETEGATNPTAELCTPFFRHMTSFQCFEVPKADSQPPGVPRGSIAETDQTSERLARAFKASQMPLGGPVELLGSP